MDKQISDALLESMDALAQNRAKSTAATLTVEAQIIEVLDAGKGSYKVKYLDNSFEALASNNEIVYDIDEMVYVLIPNGDFDKNKIILSPVYSDTISYASAETGPLYITVGDNLFNCFFDTKEKLFAFLIKQLFNLDGNNLSLTEEQLTLIKSLLSIKQEDLELDNIKNLPTEKEKIFKLSTEEQLKKLINNYTLNSYSSTTKTILNDNNSDFSFLFQNYLEDSRFFNLSCKIKTTIPPTRQLNNGNYGLKLTLPIIREIDGEEKSEDFEVILDKNNIKGNFYNFVEYALQNYYFELPEGAKFDTSKQITLSSFVEGFAQNESKINNIDKYIKDIALYSVERVEREAMKGYHLALRGKGRGGNCFLPDSSASSYNEIKSIIPTVYLNGKITSNNSFDCYWFKENTLINAEHDNYNTLGGLGWEILNEKTNIKTDENGKTTFQYITNVYSLNTVTRSEVYSNMRYKCIMVKGNTVISQIITIRNLNHYNSLTLVSATGTNKYTKNVGKVRLIIRHDILNKAVNYIWEKFDKFGNSLGNNFYTLERYNELVGDYCETEISYPTSELDETNTIKCTAYYLNIKINDDNNKLEDKVGELDPDIRIIGTKTIIVTDNLQAEFFIKVDNGDILYKYDADGDSPLSTKYDGPRINTITPISIHIFRADGSELTKDEYDITSVEWRIPVKSMISIAGTRLGYTKSEDGNYYIVTTKGNESLNYNIAEVFNNNRLDNSILIKATFLKNTIQGVANLQFIKDGEMGTNGSRYSAVITYHGCPYNGKDKDGKYNKFQIFYFVNEKENKWQYTSGNVLQKGGQPQFQVDLYLDGKTVDNIKPKIEWSIFDGKYTYDDNNKRIFADSFLSENDNIKCPFTINDNGIVTLKSLEYDKNKNYCGTIQACCTIDQGRSVTGKPETIYTYYPVEVTVIYNKKAFFDENNKAYVYPALTSGYYQVVYASDGTNPQHANGKFTVTNIVDETDLDDNYDYYWNTSENLNYTETNDNECTITPVSKFDNGCSRNYVKVEQNISASKYAAFIKELNSLIIKNQVDNKVSEIIKNYFKEYEIPTYNYINDANSLKVNIDLVKFRTNAPKQLDILGNKLSLINNLCKFYIKVIKEEDDNKKLLKESQEKINKIVTDMKECYKKVINIKDYNFEELQRDLNPNNFKININFKKYNLSEKYFQIYNLFKKELNNYNNILSNYNKNFYTQKLTSDNIKAKHSSVQKLINKLNSLINNINILKINEDSSLDIENKFELYIPNSENFSITTSQSLPIESEGYRSNNYYTEEVYKYYYDKKNKVINLNKQYINLYYQLKNYVNKLYTEPYTINEIINNVLIPISDLCNKFNLKDYKTIEESQEKIKENKYKITLYETILSSKLGTPIFIHWKPIIMLYNRYEMGNINGWDGNKTVVENNYILTPQIGAGQKENDGTFTGTVMGIKYKSGNSDNKIGLLGFYKGIETLHLSAKDGSASFGASGDGQIQIIPGQSAIIKSGNYDDTNKPRYEEVKFPSDNPNKKKYYEKISDTIYKLTSDTSVNSKKKYYIQCQNSGMQIDLTTPSIKFGSGNFKVTPEGYLTAVGGGKIGSWDIGQGDNLNILIGNNTLFLDGNKGSIYSKDHNDLESSNKGFYLSENGFSIAHKYEEKDENGKTILNNNGKPVTHTSKFIINAEEEPTIYSGGHDSLTSTKKGFYLSKEGLSIGSQVYLGSDGVIRLGKNATLNSGTSTGPEGNHIDEAPNTISNPLTNTCWEIRYLNKEEGKYIIGYEDIKCKLPDENDEGVKKYYKKVNESDLSTNKFCIDCWRKKISGTYNYYKIIKSPKVKDLYPDFTPPKFDPTNKDSVIYFVCEGSPFYYYFTPIYNNTPPSYIAYKTRKSNIINKDINDILINNEAERWKNYQRGDTTKLNVYQNFKKDSKILEAAGRIIDNHNKDIGIDTGDKQNQIYFGTDGMRFGNNFGVNPRGIMTAKKGIIGNWLIETNSLHSNNTFEAGIYLQKITIDWKLQKKNKTNYEIIPIIKSEDPELQSGKMTDFVSLPENKAVENIKTCIKKNFEKSPPEGTLDLKKKDYHIEIEEKVHNNKILLSSQLKKIFTTDSKYAPVLNTFKNTYKKNKKFKKLTITYYLYLKIKDTSYNIEFSSKNAELQCKSGDDTQWSINKEGKGTFQKLIVNNIDIESKLNYLETQILSLRQYKGATGEYSVKLPKFSISGSVDENGNVSGTADPEEEDISINITNYGDDKDDYDW